LRPRSTRARTVSDRDKSLSAAHSLPSFPSARRYSITWVAVARKHARWVVILFDYAEKNSREDLPERKIIKPSKKYNMGWENIQKRNR
jgi:hypothetical protein